MSKFVNAFLGEPVREQDAVREQGKVLLPQTEARYHRNRAAQLGFSVDESKYGRAKVYVRNADHLLTVIGKGQVHVFDYLLRIVLVPPRFERVKRIFDVLLHFDLDGKH
jgi:hypothetical protein